MIAWHEMDQISDYGQNCGKSDTKFMKLRLADFITDFHIHTNLLYENFGALRASNS